MDEPRPIDKARAGRLVIATLDQNREAYEAVLHEAITEDTLYELFGTTTAGLMAMLRLAIGDANVRQWASDWILHAQSSEEA